MNLIYRKGNYTDHADMIDLFKRSIVEGRDEFYSQTQRKAWASSSNNPDKLIDLWSSQMVLVACLDHKLAGFATLDDDYIDFVYVHPDFMRNGIGSKLVKMLIEIVRKDDFESVSTHASEFAKPMFEKLGFMPIRRNIVVRSGVELHNYEMRFSFSSPALPYNK